jgi:hypothetical protein
VRLPLVADRPRRRSRHVAMSTRHGHDDPDPILRSPEGFPAPAKGVRAKASPWSGPGPNLVYGLSIYRRLDSRSLFTSQSIAADASGASACWTPV